MDGRSASTQGPGRDGMRMVPLVSAAVLGIFSVCLAYACLNEDSWRAVPENRPTWLAAAVLFAGAAITLAALCEWDTFRIGRGGALRPSPLGILLLDLALFVFGITSIALGQAESYGRAPYGIGNVLLVAYIVAALLLFGGAFLGYGLSSRPRDRVAENLAIVHGLIAMGWGAYLTFLLVFPTVIAT